MTAIGTSELSCVEALSIGQTTITITPDLTPSPLSLTSAARALLNSWDGLYQISYPTNASDEKALISRIWFTDGHNRGQFWSAYNAIVQDPPRAAGRGTQIKEEESGIEDETSHSRENQGAHQPNSNKNKTRGMTIWCLGDDKVTQTEVQSLSDIYTVPWKVDLGGTPSRILYSRSMGKLVIAYSETHSLDTGASDPSSATTGARRLSFAKLALLDPTHAGAHPESVEIVGKSGERILGLAEWTVNIGTTRYVLIVVCASNDQWGRIGLYGRRTTESGIVRLELKKEKTTPEPVFAVAPYNDRLLCYCRGTWVILAGFVEDNGGYKFCEFGHWDLRSPAKCLTVQRPFIYASTMGETLRLLEVDEAGREMRVRGSSEASGEGRTNVFLPELSLALAATDKGVVHGLWHAPGDSKNCSLPSVFHAQLPSSITRFSVLPSHSTSPDTQMSNTEEKAPFPEIAVIGSGFDGAFYRFDFLDEPRWRLLRFLQNLAEAHPVVSPHQQSPATRWRATEPDPTKMRFLQVDGDVLARILERGGEGGDLRILKELIEEDWPGKSMNVGMEDAVERYARFCELAGAAVDNLQGRNVYEGVLLFLRDLLPPSARP